MSQKVEVIRLYKIEDACAMVRVSRTKPKRFVRHEPRQSVSHEPNQSFKQTTIHPIFSNLIALLLGKITTELYFCAFYTYGQSNYRRYYHRSS